MIDLKKTYDAIVVGSGAAGGVTAMELCEAGLQVLLLEAGPRLDPTRDFLTHRWPYEMPFRGFDKPGNREILAAIAAGEPDPKMPLEQFFAKLKLMTVDDYYTSAVGIHREPRN